MLRRRLALSLSLPLALMMFSGRAGAGGAFLPGAGQVPVEQRVAVAAGPSRTTLWTSLRFDGAAGPVGVVIPAPPLSAVDVSSDAWIEALEVATAPRVFPPEGISPYCPGEQGEADPFHVAGSIGHAVTLAPGEISVLPDAGAVALWAASNGLAFSPESAAALDDLQGKRFVAARFAAPGGPAVTRTLRVAMPGGDAALPLALTRAGGGDLLVTAWLIGPGRAALPGTTPVTLEPSSVTWNASTLETSYAEERMVALAAAAPSGAILEGASHEALSHNQVIQGTSATIDGVVTTYFERADAYGEASGEPAMCASIAAAALASGSPVAASCPRADHGVVDGADSCAEAPGPSDTDPERLRCGPAADDLAVGLSGLTPAGAWLTRYSLRIAAGQGGASFPLAFEEGEPVTPVLEAGSVSVSACGAPDAGPDGSSSGTGTFTWTSSSSGGQSTGSSPSGGSPSSGAGEVYYEDDPVVVSGCDCSGTVGTVDSGGGGYGGESSDDGGDYEAEGCASDTTETSSSDDDGCSSDTTETSSGDDGCSSDTTDTAGGDDGCSSDSSESYYQSEDSCSGSSDSSSSDGCSGSGDAGGDTSCQGSGTGSGTGEQCSIASDPQQRAQRRRPVRLSPIALGALAFLAPLRRATRRRSARPSPAA